MLSVSSGMRATPTRTGSRTTSEQLASAEQVLCNVPLLALDDPRIPSPKSVGPGSCRTNGGASAFVVITMKEPIESIRRDMNRTERRFLEEQGCRVLRVDEADVN